MEQWALYYNATVAVPTAVTLFQALLGILVQYSRGQWLVISFLSIIWFLLLCYKSLTS